jgi:hypothetical protein
MIGTSTQTAACGKCVYWHNTSPEKGECRRHAPQTVVFQVEENVRFESTFPATKAEDWCGDYEAK